MAKFVCRKCDMPAMNLAIIAMLRDAGAKGWDPLKCSCGGDHKFINVDELRKAEKERER